MHTQADADERCTPATLVGASNYRYVATLSVAVIFSSYVRVELAVEKLSIVQYRMLVRIVVISLHIGML